METVEILSNKNINLLIQLEQNARISEPDIWIDDFDADKLKADTEKALQNPLFTSARCLMCIDESGQAIGRIDFAIASSFSFGGWSQVYVDWVYVLKEFRHEGIAQFLFAQMESYLKEIGIDEYFLLMADNAEAQKFYRSIEGTEIGNHDVLRKNVK